MPILNFVLCRIDATKNPTPMLGPVKVSVLNPRTFKPQLHSLFHASQAGFEGILDKVQPVCAIDVRFPNQFDGLTVELYEDSWCSLALVIDHQDDQVSLRHVFCDLIANDAQDIAAASTPKGHDSLLSRVLADVLESSIRRRKEGSRGSSSDGAQLLPVPGCGAVLPETEQESSESEKQTQQGDPTA